MAVHLTPFTTATLFQVLPVTGFVAPSTHINLALSLPVAKTVFVIIRTSGRYTNEGTFSTLGR